MPKSEPKIVASFFGSFTSLTKTQPCDTIHAFSTCVVSLSFSRSKFNCCTATSQAQLSAQNVRGNAWEYQVDCSYDLLFVGHRSQYHRSPVLATSSFLYYKCAIPTPRSPSDEENAPQRQALLGPSPPGFLDHQPTWILC